MITHRYLIPIFILCLSLLASCAKDDEISEQWGEQRLFDEAKGELQTGNFKRAITLYGKLEARFPFGKFARQSLLDTAYAHYRLEEPDAAIDALNRFIQLYPQNPYLDYVWYLKALANFNRGMTLSKRYLPTDESQRDPGATALAFADFSYLLKEFPNSAYRQDAIKRMRYLRNRLAQHELHVANYYMRRGAFLAAANRASYIIRNYPNALVTPEALVLLSKAFKVLELDSLSQDTQRVLKMNYPDHPGISEIQDIVLE